MITIGTKINDYKINELIESNNSGQTFIATDTQLDKRVILKLIAGNLSMEHAKPVMKLSHPNIIAAYETGDYKNHKYIVMEYVNGKPLSEFIQEGSVATDFAIDVALQISDALTYAHSENVIHGDINTTNIIIDAEGKTKMGGFGLYGGKKEIQDDLHALGVVLYEMLMGRPPSESRGDNYDEAALKANLTGMAGSTSKSGLPTKLIDIVVKLVCNKNAESTLSAMSIQSADELLAELMTIPESKKLTGPKPVDWWNRYIVPAAFIIILIVAIYWLFYSKK